MNGSFIVRNENMAHRIANKRIYGLRRAQRYTLDHEFN